MATRAVITTTSAPAPHLLALGPVLLVWATPRPAPVLPPTHCRFCGRTIPANEGWCDECSHPSLPLATFWGSI